MEVIKGTEVSFIRKQINYRFSMKKGVAEKPFNYLPKNCTKGLTLSRKLERINSKSFWTV